MLKGTKGSTRPLFVDAPRRRPVTPADRPWGARAGPFRRPSARVRGRRPPRPVRGGAARRLWDVAAGRVQVVAVRLVEATAPEVGDGNQPRPNSDDALWMRGVRPASRNTSSPRLRRVGRSERYALVGVSRSAKHGVEKLCLRGFDRGDFLSSRRGCLPSGGGLGIVD